MLLGLQIDAINMPTDQSIQTFRQTLMNWHKDISRPLPWKGIKNPYRIWLSEIILQQTRVEQGLPYYEKFVAAYPKIEDLANAPEDEVLKLWEGLGYYSRAKNMHFTAKFIRDTFGGTFPDSYKDILALKGVGPYTAAAIASFAFNLPHAVVDGNVFRVLARIFGIETATDSTEGKKQFNKLAQQLLDQNQPGAYNQAIMDFGATHCKPKAPACDSCPFQTDCAALKTDQISRLPFKAKKIQKRDRFFNYILLNQGTKVLIHKRTEKDVWQGLYDFPLLETLELLTLETQITQSKVWGKFVGTSDYSFRLVSKPFRQVLSHQRINARFWEFDLPNASPDLEEHYLLIERENISKFAFPKIIDWYLQDKSLYLKLH